MPELPEVETVKRGLSPVMTGQTITKLDVRRPDLRFPFPPRFKTRVEGTKITAIERRAKFLVMALSDGHALIAHLGMSGAFRIQTLGAPAHGQTANSAHDHVIFHLQDGTTILYNDPRRFGFMALWPMAQLDNYPGIKALGPEPLSAQFSSHYLVDRLKGKTAPIKSVLLNQKMIAGLGNIYACEALFHAGIRPTRAAASLTRADNTRLAAAIKTVVANAIMAGGSSISDFSNPAGALGYFQTQFYVYGRADQPCITCGDTIKRTVQAGRSSFFCATCQS